MVLRMQDRYPFHSLTDEEKGEANHQPRQAEAQRDRRIVRVGGSLCE